MTYQKMTDQDFVTCIIVKTANEGKTRWSLGPDFDKMIDKFASQGASKIDKKDRAVLQQLGERYLASIGGHQNLPT